MPRHRLLALALVLLLPIACRDGAVPVSPSTPVPDGAAVRDLGTQEPVAFVPRDYPTIQSAVDAAPEGSTIMVAAGIYQQNVLIETSHLRLVGAGGDVILEGSMLPGNGLPALTGIGIHVLGSSAAARITDVEVSHFEVRNYVRGIVVQFATGVVVSHNYVHDNVDRAGSLVLGNGTGVELVTTSASEVSHNTLDHNGLGGVQLRVGSADNEVRDNRMEQNGWQSPTLAGVGLMATGAGTNDNRIEHNTILDNWGRGIMVARPLGTTPLISGTYVAYNEAHGNQRAGIAIMDAATGNTAVHNDARGNNLSGLPPCYRCNLFDNSVGVNTWEDNLGTFSGTDACAP
ncbi:MAG TPA: right-handed parallel beta-helix repeat-containing protein [Gemmatimonadaceae bacterium]|nr:right-handed parallel beta-helix repeat-containing protein [Gemmatimonadaceae bacterium]